MLISVLNLQRKYNSKFIIFHKRFTFWFIKLSIYSTKFTFLVICFIYKYVL